MFIIVFQQTTSLCAYVCPKFFFIELQRIFFFISSRAGHVLFSSSFTWFGFRLPPLSVPSLSKISNIFSDAFVIAVVIFATNISLSTMFAKKRGYSVDPNQVCLLRIVHEWKKHIHTVKTEEELVGDAVAFWSVHGVGFLGRHSSFTVPPHAPPPPLPGVQRGAGKLSG